MESIQVLKADSNASSFVLECRKCARMGSLRVRVVMGFGSFALLFCIVAAIKQMNSSFVCY